MDSVDHSVERSPRCPGLWPLLVGLGVAVFIGCGPVQSTTGISDAETSIERARVHDAIDHSPYEYYRAQHYLYKAKEEWGYSNFEKARDYAREARRAADAAIDNTHEAPWQGHPIYGFEEWSEELEAARQEIEDATQLEQLDELDTSDPE